MAELDGHAGPGRDAMAHVKQNVRTPEHAAREIDVLRASGLRARFSYGGMIGHDNTRTVDLADMESLHHSWTGGLISLGMAWRGPGDSAPSLRVGPEVYRTELEAARAWGLPVTLHASGYAGTSDSGFRAEVEAEEALTRGQLLADPDRPRLTGPAGAEAEQRLAAFARHALFEGQVVTDEARLLRIMKRHDPAIYPGTFVTCVYNPDRAVCRPPADTSEQPELGDCRPLACRNTALPPDNRDAHARHVADLDSALAQGDRLAPYIRHRLQQQRQDTVDFLTRHTPEPK